MAWWALAAAALLAAAGGMVRGAVSTTAAGLPVAAGAVVLEGTVRGVPATHRSEELVVVDAERLAGAGGETRVAGGVLAAVVGHPDLGPGDRVRLEATALRRPGERPGATSAAALQRDGVAAVAVAPRVQRLAVAGPGVAQALGAVRRHLAAAVGTALPPGAAAVLLEIAFGIHAAVPADTAAALRDSGLIHLVADLRIEGRDRRGAADPAAVGAGLSPRRRLLDHRPGGRRLRRDRRRRGGGGYGAP